MIGRGNIQSRDMQGQPLIKLNVGQGNNFIVKNSNIVITQNTINKAMLNPQGYNTTEKDNGIFANGIVQNPLQPQLKQKLANHQRTYSYEQKARIYSQKGPQYNTYVPNAANMIQTQNNGNTITLQKNIGIGSRNQSRFSNIPNQALSNKSGQYQGSMNNSYKHQQRKLSYSPVLKQTVPKSIQKFEILIQIDKKKAQEEILRGQQRRAHSKNDKYNNEDPLQMLIEQEDSFDQHATHMGPYTQQNFMVQNSFDKQLPQRFSPLQFSNNNQIAGMKDGSIPSRDQSANNLQQQLSVTGGSLNRPSSATLKRKEHKHKSEDYSANLRQLLQQNVQQNKDNKKFLQQKITTSNGNKKKTPIGKEEFLNNLLNGQSNPTSKFTNSSINSIYSYNTSQAANMKPNSRGHSNGGQKQSESFDYSSRNNLEKALMAYHSQQRGKDSQQNSSNQHKRSQSYQTNNKKPTVNNVQQKPQSVMGFQPQHPNEQEMDIQRAQSNKSQKRPKSNLDNPNQQMTQQYFQPEKSFANEQQPVMYETQSITNDDGLVQQRPQSKGQSNPKTVLTSQNGSTKQEDEQKLRTSSNSNLQDKNGKKPYTFQNSNPQQMTTNCVTKFAFATKTGMAPSNPNKVNQDNWITVPHFCGLKYCHFFSVCDGHGQYGREVSTQMKNRLPQFLEQEFKYVFQKYEEKMIQENKQEPLNTDEICIAFNNGFLDCNEELFNGNLDIRFSGSTCVSLVTLGQKLFCSNVGDSRGIIVKKFADGKTLAQAISRDQKPCQPDEAERILKCGGRIDSFRDPDRNPIGPLRVWLKHEDIPGLAMTRSFGDEVAARVGVIAEPGKLIIYQFIFIEILELDLCKDDKFIVIASDGVWEFLQNEDVANIVLPFFEKRNAEGAAEALVRESYLRWKQEEDDIIDDITCVIIFLDVKLPQQQSSINEHQPPQ